MLEASDTIAHAITREDWQNDNTLLRLEYPGMQTSMTLPPIYFTGLDGTQQTISASAAENAILVDTEQLPKASGNYFFTVVHFNPLERPRQRYAIRVDESLP